MNTYEGTRRRALLDGRLVDVSETAESLGIPVPVALSAELSDLLEAGTHCTDDPVYDLLAMFKLHHVGKLLPFKSEQTPDGREFRFRSFINVCAPEPEEVVAKAARGRGDMGEEVVTISLPEESFVFTGQLTRIRAEYLLNLSRFLDKDATSGLSLVRVEPQGRGAVLVGLDGHSLGAFFDPDAYCREAFCLKLTPGLLRECKPKSSERGERYVILDDGRATVEDALGKVLYIEPEPVVVAGSYTDWRHIVERSLAREFQDVPAHAALIAPESLAAFTLQGKRPERGIRLFCGGPCAPIVVRHNAYPEFLGLVMPLTVKETAAPDAASGFPDWLRPEPAAFAAVDSFMDEMDSALADAA